MQTYPHIVENRGITMAPLILRLISWKSLPQSIKIFFKLDFFTNVLVVWFVFVYTATLLRSSADCTRKEVPFWFWQWQRCEFWIDWVRLFDDINIKNKGAIAIPWFSSICGEVRTSFGDMRETFSSGCLWTPHQPSLRLLTCIISNMFYFKKEGWWGVKVVRLGQMRRTFTRMHKGTLAVLRILM